MTFPKIPGFRQFAALTFMFIVLGGCYMPMRYDAEIEITRQGYYKFIFDGYLAKVELYDGIRRNKIDLTKEKEEIEKIRKDFATDANASDFAYHRKGYFRVHWEREGDILKSKTVIFLRRNEYILGMSYNRKTGRVGMQGRSLKKDTRNKLAEIGLGGTNGEIRVITDLPMIASNATKVAKNRKRGPGFKTYTLEDQEHLRAAPKPHSGASVESTLAK
ncbi:MAG: hypothetical protein HN877_09620 [Rhodospirillaceae bacterium]|nr:hypothetical protein [Rhodospirillaceae bacterium]